MENNNSYTIDYVTATNEYVTDKVTYIVMARPSETAKTLIHVKVDALIKKEIRKLSNKLAMLAAT